MIALRNVLRIPGLLVIILAVAALPAFAQQKKPNIIVIFGDDVGVWNLSTYHRGMMGGRTPNIDRIANEGALFTDYYAPPGVLSSKVDFPIAVSKRIEAAGIVEVENLLALAGPFARESAADVPMLEWTQAGNGARLMMLVLHDDPEREYAYGPAAGLPDSKVGTFSQGLFDEAKSKGWTVISMKKDWKHIFAFAK